MSCAICNRIVASLVAHYQNFHPETCPNLDPKAEKRALVSRVEERVGRQYFVYPEDKR